MPILSHIDSESNFPNTLKWIRIINIVIWPTACDIVGLLVFPCSWFAYPHPLNHSFSGRGTPICNLHFLGGGWGGRKCNLQPPKASKNLSFRGGPPYDGQFEAIWQLAATAMCLPILVYDK